MKKLSEYKHLFFQKMQSGALILRAVRHFNNDIDFEVISSNEYIYDLKHIEEDLCENMISVLAQDSELFAAIETAVHKFNDDGIENHRYLFKNKSMLIKMNIFYIQKGIICVLIREKRNEKKNYEIESDQLLEIYDTCFAEMEESVIISDFYDDTIILSNIGGKEDLQYSSNEVKSKKITELIQFDYSWESIKEDLNRGISEDIPVYSEGIFTNSDGEELPFLAKIKRFELNSKTYLLTIGLMK